MSSSSSSSKPENGKKTLILDTDIIKMRESTAFTETPAATQAKADLETATRYVITDTRRHKFNFCIGAFTVFLVVAFIALLQSSIARSPIIFLKLAEDEVGEFDLLMVPKPTASSTLGVPTVQTSLFNQSNAVQQEQASISSGFLLNFTEIQRRTANVDELVGVAPRWLALSRVTKIDNHLINSTAIVLVIDSVQEAKIQLGRVWSHRALGRDETHVASVVLRRLGVKANAGENITMVIDLLDLAGQVGGLDVTSAETLLGRFVGEGVVQTLANVSIAGVLDQINNATGQEFTLDAVEAYLATAFGITRPPSIDPNQSLTSIMFDFVKEALTIRRNLTVIDGVDSPDGKYPKALGNVMLLEKEHVHDIIAQPLYNAANALRSLQKNLQENLSLLPLELALETALNVSTPVLQTAIQQFIDGIEAAEQFELDHYALSVAGMYRDRLDSYVGTRTEIQHDMIHFTNAVVDGLGYDAPVEMQTTLATSLGALYFIRLFLDQIFNFSSIVLIGLGSLLIYSLLLSNVEEKTFEYGMLRAQGMRQYVLIELLCIQSLWFSIPGIAAGLFAAWLLYIPIAILINVYVNVPIDLSLDGLAIGIAVIVGLCMPVIANIVPISQALSSTLRNALDVYHQSEGEVTVTTVELSKVGLAPWQVMLSTLMIVMGFVVYYMMPYSFIFNNIPLFLFLLTLILLGMLVGLSMVAQILQSPLEKGVSWLFMWGSERRRLRPLVLKALYAHGRRNRKTAVMFTTALAFIIFTGTSFALQGHSIADNVELGVGADLVVLAPSTNFPVNKDAMASYLDLEMERRKQGAKDAHVLGYAYETYPLSNYDFIRSTSISNMAGYPSLRCRVVGMAEKYVDETYTKFYNPSESAEGFDFKESRNGEPDVIDALYSNAGKLKLPLEQAKGSRIPPNVISADVAGLDEERGSPETGYPIVRSNEESYNNYIDVVVSESVRLQGAIDTETPLLLGISYKESVVNTTYIAFFAKAQGMIAKMAGDLSYSSYRQLASLSKVAVSIPQYERLLTTLRNSSSVAQELGVQGVSTGATAPPKAGTGGKGKPPQIQKLYVRLSEEATELEREAIVNALRNFIRDDITQVLDARTLVASTATAISLLQYFFIVVTAIAVTMCFFVLWLSFTANIRENAWEFGVLRAIGLSSSQVMRVYVYEAACLITASLLLGTLIGMAQAMTLTLQFNLFTELPFTFDFPWTLFALVVVLSFVVAIAGSYYPAREYRDKQISSVIKGK